MGLWVWFSPGLENGLNFEYKILCPKYQCVPKIALDLFPTETYFLYNPPCSVHSSSLCRQSVDLKGTQTRNIQEQGHSTMLWHPSSGTGWQASFTQQKPLPLFFSSIFVVVAKITFVFNSITLFPFCITYNSITSPTPSLTPTLPSVKEGLGEGDKRGRESSLLHIFLTFHHTASPPPPFSKHMEHVVYYKSQTVLYKWTLTLTSGEGLGTNECLLSIKQWWSNNVQNAKHWDIMSLGHFIYF